MIRNPTVLILGAGASTTYGFPLGGQLVDLILGLLQGSTSPLLKALIRLEVPQGDIETFRDDLDGSGLRSIDLFLEDLKPDDVYVKIGKVAIAYLILSCEKREMLVRPKKTGDHWYEYVWNLMRPGSSPENLNQNGLRIVTFNYERSFEYYFASVIKHSFRLDDWGEAWSLFESSVPVIHLHGHVGESEHFGAHSKGLSDAVVHQAARSIRIVHDPVATDDPQFKQARDLISNASCVAFIGFGYHPTNLNRLNLQECLTQEIIRTGQLFASTYKMGAAEIELANEAIGISEPRVRFAPTNLDALEFLREHAPLR